MRNLLIILVLFVLSSCSNTPINVDNPEKVTTVELQELAKADTVVYKVVELDNSLYVLDNIEYKVIKKVSNYSGVLDTFIILLFCSFFLLVIAVSIKA